MVATNPIALVLPLGPRPRSYPLLLVFATKTSKPQPQPPILTIVPAEGYCHLGTAVYEQLANAFMAILSSPQQGCLAILVLAVHLKEGAGATGWQWGPTA